MGIFTSVIVFADFLLGDALSKRSLDEYFVALDVAEPSSLKRHNKPWKRFFRNTIKYPTIEPIATNG